MDFHRKTFNYELSNPSKMTKINGAAQFSSTIKKIFNRIGIAETNLYYKIQFYAKSVVFYNDFGRLQNLKQLFSVSKIF